MKLAKILVLVVAVVLLSFSMVYAKPEYTKSTGKPCATCHTKGKELNDVGKCYEKTKKLEGCKAEGTKPAK
jgi:hypothetical protein